MSDTRTNEQWLNDLNASGEIQEIAIADLRNLLLRAALYFFSRNLNDLVGMDREDILQRAEDCAQEALIAVMTHLPEFRGDSRFTTWAYKFAINFALMSARRERWKGKSLEQISVSDGRLFEGALPDRFAIQREIGEILQDVIEHELTDRQRDVLVLMVFNEVPMDVVVQRLGTNRNAIYKMLHDARSKLKRSLEARGFELGELFALFRDPR